nr:immunoglobulin light chain junction region [Macaca mulatta]
CGQVTHWPYTF